MSRNLFAFIESESRERRNILFLAALIRRNGGSVTLTASELTEIDDGAGVFINRGDKPDELVLCFARKGAEAYFLAEQPSSPEPKTRTRPSPLAQPSSPQRNSVHTAGGENAGTTEPKGSAGATERGDDAVHHAPLLTGDPVKDRDAALKKYDEVMRQFTSTFKTSESEAYGNLLRDLMDYSSLFIAGQIMSAKEILDKTEDLQVHLKKSGGMGGKSMGDLFNSWINGEEAQCS
jgi:hypothetical protein